MKRRGLWKWLSIAFSLFVATAAIGVSFIDVGYAAQTGTFDNWTNSTIGLNYEYEAQTGWTYDSNSSVITGYAQTEAGSGCDGDTHHTTKLNITCKANGTLSFNYKITSNGGTLSVNGNSYASDGRFEEAVVSGDLIPIVLTSNNSKKKIEVQVSQLQIEIPVAPASIRFVSNALCDYVAYVNGVSVALDTDVACHSGDDAKVEWKSVSENCRFVGWKKDDMVESENNPYSFKVSNDNEVVEPVVVNQVVAVFEVDGLPFVDLQKAIDHAKKTAQKIVRLRSSGQVSAKTDSSPYSFTNGVHLFVPGTTDSAFSDYAKTHPAEGVEGKYTCNMKLRLLAGVNLEFGSGSKLVIAGDMWYTTGGKLTSLPVGKIGEMILDSGAVINLNDGAELYCWGYASGDGEIHALSGSKVYESFSFYFRGGTVLSKIYKKAFLFNQYYVQNIECSLHLHYGSSDSVSFRISYSIPIIGEQRKSESFVFVGANGMFVLKEDSTLIKKYNRDQDRMEYRVVGNGTLSHIQVTVAGNTVDSADYILPMNNNMDIIVESGELTLEQNVEFLPEATLTVNEGGTVVVGSNRTMLFYDLSNWKGKKYGSGTDIVQINYVSPYSEQKGYFKRSDATIKKGAKLVLNGVINNSGSILSTKPESDTQTASELAGVVSSGNGKMTYLTKEYKSDEIISTKFKQPQNNSTPVEISSKPIVYINSDDSEFSGVCPAGEALVYETGFWKVQHQGPSDITITFKNEDGTAVIGTKTYTVDGNGFELPNQTEFAGFQGTIFLWLEETDKTRCYEPKTNIKTIRDDITLIAFIGGWYTDLNKDTYYYDRDAGKTKGIKYIYEEGTWPEDLYCFDENGALLKNEDQVFVYEQGDKYDGSGDGNIYFVNDGVVQNDKGLANHDIVADGTVKTYYYYFGPAHYAYRNTTCYIDTNLNNLLPAGVYTFGNDGRVEVLECLNFEGVDSVSLSADGYCTFGTIKAGIGLFTSGTHIYYAKDDGSIMTNGTYYVEEGKLNGKVANAGLYYFDANGYLCDSMMNPIEVTPPEANA